MTTPRLDDSTLSFAVYEAPLFSLLVQGENDEGLLKESVESLVDLVKAAQGLVRRIEDAVDKYLFWDEEVQVYEAVNAVRMGGGGGGGKKQDTPTPLPPRPSAFLLQHPPAITYVTCPLYCRLSYSIYTCLSGIVLPFL